MRAGLAAASAVIEGRLELGWAAVDHDDGMRERLAVERNTRGVVAESGGRERDPVAACEDVLDRVGGGWRGAEAGDVDCRAKRKG